MDRSTRSSRNKEPVSWRPSFDPSAFVKSAGVTAGRKRVLSPPHSVESAAPPKGSNEWMLEIEEIAREKGVKTPLGFIDKSRSHGFTPTRAAKVQQRLFPSPRRTPDGSAAVQHLAPPSTAIASAQPPTVSPPDVNEFYGLGLPVRQLYLRRGISELYDWQRTCLEIACAGQSVLYSMPTSGGKTLVAEIMLLRAVLLQRKKALLVLPYVSLVAEKAMGLSEFAEVLGCDVQMYCGAHGSTADVPKHAMIAVCTIEKATGLVSTLQLEGRLDEVALVVVDELHMLGDGDRGVLLETLLTKLRVLLQPPPQTIAMSATISNIGDVAQWLGAREFTSDWRPVPLRQFYKVGSVLYDSSGVAVRTLQMEGSRAREDPDHVALLCSEVMDTKSVLVFCATKRNVEACAELIARNLPQSAVDEKAEERTALLAALKAAGTKSDDVLARVVLRGVAYHHAGLTMDERELLEAAFRDRVVRVLTCTSTLAAGVNLPAGRVIIRSPFTGSEQLTAARYLQMCGRAGRKGYDEYGESIIIATPQQEQLVLSLMNLPLPPLRSCVSAEAMTGIVLEAICLRVPDLYAFAAATFYARTGGGDAGDTATALRSAVDSALASLLAAKLIAAADEDNTAAVTEPCELAGGDTGDSGAVDDAPRDVTGAVSGKYIALPLGMAAFRANLSPAAAGTVHDRLLNAQRALCLLDELHVCVCCTPPQPEAAVNWRTYAHVFSKLSESATHVAQLVGVDAALIHRRAFRTVVQAADKQKEASCTLFFRSLMLWDLINEMPSDSVAAKYGVERGYLQSLMDNAGRYAAAMTAFCKEMDWSALEALIGRYSARLEKGVRQELVALVAIPMVGRTRARQLFAAGYKTVQDVAQARVDELAARTKHIGKKNAGIIVMHARRLAANEARVLRQQAEDQLRALGAGDSQNSTMPSELLI